LVFHVESIIHTLTWYHCQRFVAKQLWINVVAAVDVAIVTDIGVGTALDVAINFTINFTIKYDVAIAVDIAVDISDDIADDIAVEIAIAVDIAVNIDDIAIAVEIAVEIAVDIAVDIAGAIVGAIVGAIDFLAFIIAAVTIAAVAIGDIAIASAVAGIGDVGIDFAVVGIDADNGIGVDDITLADVTANVALTVGIDTVSMNDFISINTVGTCINDIGATLVGIINVVTGALVLAALALNGLGAVDIIATDAVSGIDFGVATFVAAVGINFAFDGMDIIDVTDDTVFTFDVLTCIPIASGCILQHGSITFRGVWSLSISFSLRRCCYRRYNRRWFQISGKLHVIREFEPTVSLQTIII
jgi:hypothetical protein